MDFITREFSGKLRERIGSDKVIAARDVSGYVQMVLAPELATHLIMEDMDMSKEQARDIMDESADLGDILHGSTEDDTIMTEP
jgi:hypothetical protein